MKYTGDFFARFSYLIILLNLLLLTICIIFKRFGLAENLGNFFVGLSIFITGWQLFKTKINKNDKFKHIDSSKYLLLGWSLTILAAILTFNALFLTGPAVWGDAPYYFAEAFREFLLEPSSWNSRGSLGIVNDLYWIYPLMLIYYGLGYLGFGNEIIIRILFYFPAILFALLAPWLYSRYLGFSSLVSLFSAAVYTLNTYFILVVDGGQIGVGLAYGLFPLTLMQLHKLITNTMTLQFLKSLATVMFLIIADLRLAAIAILAFLIWVGFEYINYMKKLGRYDFKILILFILAILALSAYWLVPAIKLQPTTGAGIRSDVQLISILNPLFLYAPHWPLNEYGKISPPQWLFVGIPLLIFSNLLFKKSRQVNVLIFNFLLFVILAKGDSGLLGGVYGWMVDNIPFGGAFRDSTKFFAPVLLFGGILIGLSVENFQNLFKRKLFSKIIVMIAFTYLLALIYPALVGNMNGVLAGRQFSRDLEVIADQVSSENDFLRTAWFPERHPLAFSTERKPALDGKNLVNLRTFASLNTGTHDVFNFLHEPESIEWFKVLGIKYLIFSGDTRKTILTGDDSKDWKNLLELTATTAGLIKEDWGTQLPVYKISDTFPKIFATNKLLAVVGSDSVFKDIPPTAAAVVFLEDGKFDPRILQKVDVSSAVLVFNGKNEVDLQMSLQQGYFLNPVSSEWANRESSAYLKWRYELLVNGVATREFDFGKGIKFSTVNSEHLVFNLELEGEYYLAIRYLSPSGNLEVELNDFKKTLQPTNDFRWFISEPLKGQRQSSLIIENNGFNIVNAVAVIPKKDFMEGAELAKELMQKFEVYNLDKDRESLLRLVKENKFEAVGYDMVSPYKYKVSSNGYSWIFLTDSYNDLWKANGETSYPIYSIVNGFYVPGVTNVELYFEGQNIVNIGVKLSFLVLGTLTIIIVAINLKKRLS